MRKKGFTLIELLAVIVILVIIALIATPIILGIIENAKKGASSSSALGYIDAVEKKIATNLLDSDTLNDIVDGSYTCDTLKTYGVDVKGEKPTACILNIEKSQVVSGTITINGYTFEIENGKIIGDGSEYTITINNVVGGTIKANKNKAIVGETVTLSVIADNGYELKSLKYNNIDIIDEKHLLCLMKML